MSPRHIGSRNLLRVGDSLVPFHYFGIRTCSSVLCSQLLSIFLLMYYEAEKGWPRRTVLMDPRCKSLRDTHKQMTCMQEA